MALTSSRPARLDRFTRFRAIRTSQLYGIHYMPCQWTTSTAAVPTMQLKTTQNVSSEYSITLTNKGLLGFLDTKAVLLVERKARGSCVWPYACELITPRELGRPYKFPLYLFWKDRNPSHSKRQRLLIYDMWIIVYILFTQLSARLMYNIMSVP